MLKKQALRVLETLEQNGYQAYFVGGCVRDWLLGRPVHDIDICTDAHPGEVMRLFPDCVPTGLRHGTVSVKQGGILFEVTTFRTESGYHDYRRPESVSFVRDVRIDLARRDFTVNAMAMNRAGALIDPFGGREDLARRVIRAVGDPVSRFQEDALRMLRAARFAAKLDFAVEPATREAMAAYKERLTRIAVERVREELHKLVDSDTPVRGMTVMAETGLLSAWPLIDRLFSGGMNQASRLPLLTSLPHKWSLLMYSAGLSPDEARQVCRQLKMSNRETAAIVQMTETLTEIHPGWDEPVHPDWTGLLLRRGWTFCRELDAVLAVMQGGGQSSTPSPELVAAYERMPAKSLKELAVTGQDLVERLNRPAGAWIGRTLQSLWEKTARHGLPNTREALLAAARSEVERDEHQTGDLEGAAE